MDGKVKGIILDEIVRDKEGNVIATREFINEIVCKGSYSECVTREVIKLENGRIVIDQVIYRTKIKKYNNHQATNLLIGTIIGN